MQAIIATKQGLKIIQVRYVRKHGIDGYQVIINNVVHSSHMSEAYANTAYSRVVRATLNK